MALIGVQVEGKALLGQIIAPAQIFQAGERVAPGQDGGRSCAQAKTLLERLLTLLACALVGVGSRVMQRPTGRAVAVVVDDESALVVLAVGVSKDVFVHRA